MRRDWMSLEALRTVLGVCLSVQQGAGLTCHIHLLCRLPAPNLAAGPPACKIASQPDGKLSFLSNPFGMELSPFFALAFLPVCSSGYIEND